jgi:hypothetical protein
MSAQPDLFSVPVADAVFVGSYYNTVPITGDDLKHARAAAAHQDDLVLRIFAKAGKPLSPSQVWRIGCDQGERWLLTSVRRSITNLTNANPPRLRKTGDRREGQYGRPEMVWATATELKECA